MKNNFFKFDIPIIKSNEKNRQSEVFLFKLSLYLRIIKDRIHRRERKFAENFQSERHLENLKLAIKLSLDILSFYSFSQDYLNYLIIFLHKNYFQNWKYFYIKTFKNHYNNLDDIKPQGHKIETQNHKLKTYKEILKRYAPSLLNISKIRDDMIVHRDAKIDDFFNFIPSDGKGSIHFVEPFKERPKSPQYRTSKIDEIYQILQDFTKEIKDLLDNSP